MPSYSGCPEKKPLNGCSNSSMTILPRKRCHNNKHFSELVPHHGRKTAGV